MRPTRVLILVNRLGLGGGEVFAANCALAMDRARFDVSVCYFHGDDTLRPLLQDGGIPARKLDGHRRLDATAFASLFDLLRSERIDVLQTHLPYSGIVGRAVGRLARTPVIVSTEQNNLDDYHLRTRLLNDLTLGLADAIVCISEGVRNSLIADSWLTGMAGRPIVRVIHNGIDLGRIERGTRPGRAAKRAELGLATGDFVIGNIGRLELQKGQRYLIEAMPRILAEVPSAKLIIVGKGPLRDDLRSQVDRLSLGPHVKLLGERTDVIEVLEAVDLFAFPSNYEGLGVVLLEALAVERPVVASGIPGVTDIVTHGETGILVPRRDAQELAHAIVALSRDPDRAATLAANGRRRVRDRFSIGAIAARYEELYCELLDRRGTTAGARRAA